MLQPGRFVAQHVAGRPFADHLHLVEKHIVGIVLQRQQLANGAVFDVYTLTLSEGEKGLPVPADHG
jgi:hypothetical protein